MHQNFHAALPVMPRRSVATTCPTAGASKATSATISGRRLGGSWAASTLVDHAKVEETIGVMLEVLESLAVAPPSEDDLNIRKAMLRGSFGRLRPGSSGLRDVHPFAK